MSHPLCKSAVRTYRFLSEVCSNRLQQEAATQGVPEGCHSTCQAMPDILPAAGVIIVRPAPPLLPFLILQIQPAHNEQQYELLLASTSLEGGKGNRKGGGTGCDGQDLICTTILVWRTWGLGGWTGLDMYNNTCLKNLGSGRMVGGFCVWMHSSAAQTAS